MEVLTVGSLGVVFLAGRVEDEVEWPSKEELSDGPKGSADRRVTDSFPKLGLHRALDLGALEVLAAGVKGRDVIRVRRASLGYEDLVLCQVAGVCVVLGVLNEGELEVSNEYLACDTLT